MSATNWALCPKCEIAREKNKKEKARAIAKSYGKVSATKYLEMLAKFKEKQKERVEETLREDYEQGVSDGQYSVFYRGKCEECGFEYNFEHTAKVL